MIKRVIRSLLHLHLLLHLLLILILIPILPSCRGGGGLPDTTGEPADFPVEKKVTVDPEKTFQTIDGFAASDCWTGNIVGRDWDDVSKESIARLLFSREIRDGNPQGIGLSMWRFNLGAGTAGQGDDSGIEDESRRAESFLKADGSYDWTKHRGQQYFIEKARDYGCESFVMFSNSPPVQYTCNGKGFSSRGAGSNLKEEHYDDFARYMATVAEYFLKNKNIRFTHISPVNEPQYNWDGGQEGSGWQNGEIKKIVVELDRALSEKSLDTKILITESGDWEYLFSTKNDAGRSNQIENFFSPESENYLGDLPHVPRLIAGHSYWTDANLNAMRQTRTLLREKAGLYGLKIYQTEWSLLGDHFDDSDYPGHDGATEMDIALHMNKVIHQDLVTAGVSSWSFWTAMDASRWGHKNRFLLVRLLPAGGEYAALSGGGTLRPAKTLWALGNYSLFVKPGYTRVDLQVDNPSDLFFGSAWTSPLNDKLVVIYANMSARTVRVDMGATIPPETCKTVKRYTTSASKDLTEEIPEAGHYLVESGSITTFVFSN
ncbi:MAG: beta-glycosidase [Proteiniphilum sp.]|jgi:O-glycosyl hydrolase|nr:beta-glycosidase [Proteiniphilum sp.]